MSASQCDQSYSYAQARIDGHLYKTVCFLISDWKTDFRRKKMKKWDIRLIAGALLIILGGLFLLQNTGFLSGTWDDILGAVVLGLGGALLLSLYISRRRSWWLLIPSVILLFLALGNVLEILFPRMSSTFTGLVILAGIGVSFLTVYLSDRNQWWAIIPGGVLISLGITDFLENISLTGFDTDGVLFIGLGLTFLILTLLPTPSGRIKWGIYPGIPLLVFGLFLSFDQGHLWNYIWPALVIILGVLLLFGAFRKKG
jgi:hypothetical protein